jgi:hypothetical protein
MLHNPQFFGSAELRRKPENAFYAQRFSALLGATRRSRFSDIYRQKWPPPAAHGSLQKNLFKDGT